MDSLPPIFWLGVTTGVLLAALLVVGFFAFALRRPPPEPPTWEQLLEDQ